MVNIFKIFILFITTIFGLIISDNLNHFTLSYNKDNILWLTFLIIIVLHISLLFDGQKKAFVGILTIIYGYILRTVCKVFWNTELYKSDTCMSDWFIQIRRIWTQEELSCILQNWVDRENLVSNIYYSILEFEQILEKSKTITELSANFKSLQLKLVWLESQNVDTDTVEALNNDDNTTLILISGIILAVLGFGVCIFLSHRLNVNVLTFLSSPSIPSSINLEFLAETVSTLNSLELPKFLTDRFPRVESIVFDLDERVKVLETTVNLLDKGKDKVV